VMCLHIISSFVFYGCEMKYFLLRDRKLQAFGHEVFIKLSGRQRVKSKSSI
jgi:hypothetical protein